MVWPLYLTVLAIMLLQIESASVGDGMNPIRKVVNMLTDMQAKITEEGKKDEELHEAYKCYCKQNSNDLQSDIEGGGAKIEALSADLKASTERKTETEASLAEHRSSHAEAKDTMTKATALREKESAKFATVKSDLDTNIAAIDKAVAALEKGAAGSFMQTSAAAAIRRLVVDRADLPDASRQDLLAFLAGSHANAYAPQSGDITGILKQLGDEMRKDLGDASTDETGAIKNYEALTAAKKKEVAVLQAQIEDEMSRVGRLGIQNAEMANDIGDTQAALEADQKFAAQLKGGCDSQDAKWEELKNNRAGELVALAETIKVLNDDDALELFKSTLPSPAASLLQVTVPANRKTQALDILRRSASKAKRPELDLITLALRGKKIGFEKVLGLIDGMIDTLNLEQHDDDAKKEYCNTQIDQTEDKQKQLELSVGDAEKAMEDLEGQIQTVSEEIEALGKGLKKLDASVAEATTQRKNENEEHTALIAANTNAKKILDWAKNRLNKWYAPALYKPPPNRELSEADRITVNLGGDAPSTPPPGGIAGTGIGAEPAFVQIRAHFQARRARDAPPPPPETFGAYSKKGQEHTGVIAMIDLLGNDLDKEMTESNVNEADAQKDYEKLMADAADKRAADSKSISEKESAKASSEEELQSQKEKHTADAKDLLATAEYLKGLHDECDWNLKYHDVRKNARSSEIESLTNAKAVLKGANYSFLQQDTAGGFLAKRK